LAWQLLRWAITSFLVFLTCGFMVCPFYMVEKMQGGGAGDGLLIRPVAVASSRKRMKAEKGACLLCDAQTPIPTKKDPDEQTACSPESFTIRFQTGTRGFNRSSGSGSGAIQDLPAAMYRGSGRLSHTSYSARFDVNRTVAAGKGAYDS
jgi:hypothetical protein